MGRVRSARAHWLRRDVIAWNGWIGPGVTHQLESIPLTHDPRGLPDELRARFPHLRDFHALIVAPESFPKIPEVLRGEVVVSATRGGEMLDATAAQIAGVLDDLYVWDGPLGVSWSNGTPTVRLWAPTARSVRILFPDGKAEAMSFDRGVWTIQGTPRWRDRFYRFEVEVYARSTGRIEKNLVTDPYSLSLGTNSQWSHIVDLDDPRLKPDGWDHFPLPPLERFEDIVIYELHVRDFSMSDPSVPPELRGTYLAFTQEESFGMRHLRSLAEAGLTHLHLLPVFDFASVQDNRTEHRHPGDLSGFPPDSPQQQKAILRIKDLDGFNWGYDPLHFTVPEGSYATDPNGWARIREFRAMVKSLAAAGLRVVMDVVFNHTYTAGQEETTVLDRIVPGYYHRLSGEGMVETSSCCPNTATENAMMEKLMIDSVRTWAKAYRIDAFRFDLMGHHLKSNMLKVREALGPGHYLYGEGWDFGEMAQNARGVNGTQRNLAGTGIGTFNDRFRDALRGGGPFGGLRDQGFATGLAADPQNIVRDGLAGSMEITGGFRKSAVESVNYAAAHDNETLFDVIQLKAPQDAGLNERARMNHLALSVIMLAQGIPFFHAGDELLRSKSFDRNSFNSGDWFNRLDFTMQSTAFGAGLPPEHENGKHWEVMGPLLADPSLRPSPAHIRRAFEHFLEMLRIRKSSPLFRLSDQRSIAEHLRFLPSESGTIALVLRSERELILVAFNAHRTAKTMHLSDLAGLPLALHAVLQRSSDEIVRQTRFDQATGSLAIPALTAVVLGSLLPRPA